jgi:hypothetical protein
VDAATIIGCRAKVGRAEYLLKPLAEEWSAFLDEKPWPSRVENGSEPDWYSIYFDFSTPPPPVLSVMVGELAHDLRSCLDHLAWREAVEGLGREPTKDEGRGIGFPLARDESDFKSAEVLRYVSHDARTALERSQPYNRSTSEEGASLRVIHWYNRLDKHRTLHVATVRPPGAFSMDQLKVSYTRGASILAVEPHLTIGQRVEGDTKVVSVRFAPDGPEPHMQVEGQPPFNPSFGDLPADMAGADVHLSISTVEKIVSDFANLVP